MSVRIHALAKEIKKTSKEVLEILVDRGYELKSASSTIDNITAESLVAEFKSDEVVEDSASSSVSSPASGSATQSSPPADSSSSKIPLVKSKADIEREKKEKDDAELAEQIKQEPEPKIEKVQAVVEEVAPTPTMAPPPPVTKANAPPPPVSAGKPKVPAPPASKVSPVESIDTEQDGVVEGNLVIVKPPIVVRDFAVLLGLKPFQLISELMEMGIFASMNQTIDEDVARKIAQVKGFELEIKHRGEKADKPKAEKQKVDEDDESLLQLRPPVVCILGHVDHGKTTLLDSIRKANVVDGEAGGITQHVAAYQITHGEQKITFLDTPGHAAFSKIRERGANLTDVSVLVVAADDGFMPQTDEALKFAQRSQSAMLVAINKTDTKGADVERVKTQMQERSIPPEDWGGDIVTVPISAINGENVDELLDMILLQAEVMELKANPDAVAEGIIIEARQEIGRGPTATVIIQKGTLKVGDSIYCGDVYCKVKAMIDDQGNQVKTAPPSTPVNILGWSGVPNTGVVFRRCKNEREARREVDDFIQVSKKVESVPEEVDEEASESSGVEALFAAISKSKATTYKVILKADVRGSLEALQGSLELIESDKILLEVLQGDIGPITKNDVQMADTSGADILGFNVKLDNGVMGEAKHKGVQVFQNSIIYEIIDLVKENMAELLEPETIEKKSGRAEVRQVFRLSKGRTVAGSMVMEGSITRNRGARLVRGKEVIAEGKIDTLKRFKDDVTEVKAGFECGIRLDGFDRYEEGDVIESFELEKTKPTL
jgi:translation initiation factor IF-2